MMQTYDEALAFIHAQPHGGAKDTFARMDALLAALGNPQNELPPVIHVTGTNGKGSVSTMTAAVLSANGLKTGLFISPFIMDFRERIQIDGEMIAQADLVRYVQRIAAVLPTLDSEAPTEFEVVTALMLRYFADQKLDAAVIEVGIGGRWDSTNVLPSAKVAVITSVGYDHQNMLGNTLTEIAQQKAGIIHDGMQVVIGQLPDEARAVLPSDALIGRVGEFEAPLAGDFQRQNTATAVAALRAFKPDLTDAQIQAGLTQVHFPARYEFLTLPAHTVILDGAHNAEGLRALRRNLQLDADKLAPYTLIFGSLADKNAVEILPELLAQLPLTALILVPFAGPNQRNSVDVKAIAQQLNDNRVTIAADWQTALQQAQTQTVVMTGSLYLMSEIRQTLLRIS